MSLEQNLADAKLAVAHVKERMTYGAANRLSDVFDSRGSSLGCVLGMRTVRKLTDWGWIDPAEGEAGKLSVEKIALDAERNGCGNCGEQSASAWVFLWKKGVRPLDWMHFTNGDHAFVVVGRANGSNVNDPSSWGATAVVCDPWEGISFPVTEIATHFPKSTTYGVLIRID